MATELYRRGQLGDSLVQALDELVTSGKLPPSIAMETLKQFDNAFIECIELDDKQKEKQKEEREKQKATNNNNTAKDTINQFREKEKALTTKGSFKGKLDVYRYIDNVWTMVVSDTVFKLAPTATTAKKDEEEVQGGTVRLVLVDAKVVKPDKPKDK